MNKLVKKLMLVAAMLMLAAGPSFAADAIRIGLMCPLTGKWASEGQDMQQIVSLLVSEVNKAGGINGKQIEALVGGRNARGRSAHGLPRRPEAGLRRGDGGHRDVRFRRDRGFPEHHR